MVRGLKRLLCSTFILPSLFSIDYLWASDFKLGVETQYEYATDKFIVENVKSAYSLGTIGLNIIGDFEKNVSIIGTYGVGYHPNYKTEFSGTGFNGPVVGRLLGFRTRYLFFDDTRQSAGINFYISERTVEGDDFRGVRNGQNLTVQTKAKMKLNEFALEYRNKVSQLFDVGGSVGVSAWSFEGSGVSFLENIAISKTVSDNNEASFMSVFAKIKTAKPVTISLSRRSYSLDNFVESYELTANFAL